MQITFDPWISEWDNPISWRDITSSSWGANAGNWNILVPAGKENNNDSPSSGERTGKSPNHSCYGMDGVVGPRRCKNSCERNSLERLTRDGDSPVFEARRSIVVSWVARNTRNSAWICRDHPVRLNTPERPIVDQYREGKVKSTSNRRVKEYLKPCAYKRSEHESVTACLLHNEPTSYRIWQG